MESIKMLILGDNDLSGFSKNKSFENVEITDFDRQSYHQILNDEFVIYKKDDEHIKILKDRNNVSQMLKK